ncbi:MAG: PAS domain S-box protein [Verrucomicrobia bacterium]|nr:PAS domain S-box protein [Verrucomicrobiota bacterium]
MWRSFLRCMTKKTGERVGTICLIAHFQDMRERVQSYSLIVALFLAISFVIAYLLSGRLQRLVSEPILDLVRTAKVISDRNDYSIRAQKRTEDELGSFVQAFNQMLGQIQQQDQALRQAKEKLEERVQERTRKLLELQRQNELILNSAAEGICGLDIDGKMTFVNPTAARTIGWTIPELVNQSEHSILRHSNSDGRPYREDDCPICDPLRAGEPFRSEDEVLWREDGTSFHAAYARTSIVEDGKLVGAVVVFKDITSQKLAELELELLNKQLRETSRQAGMQEVATGVLHNVGNVLNSVNVSATLLSDRIRQIQTLKLAQVGALLQQHAQDFAAFVEKDPKGQMLFSYLINLTEHLAEEHATMRKELELLVKHVEHIKDIIVMQQSYSKVSAMVEPLFLADLVEDALQINADLLKDDDIVVLRDYEDMPQVSINRHIVLQILVNLIRNARHALHEAEEKQLWLSIRTQGGRAQITVRDNGIGIRPENLTRIFSHGFTTKKDGHGFGLHIAAWAAREMGGALTVQSDGPRRGATFTLELPLTSKELRYEYSR